LFNSEPEKVILKNGVERELRRKVHQALKRVTQDFEEFEFNTIVSTLMELLNFMYDARDGGAYGTSAWDESLDLYARMMAPVTPHIAEELWVEVLGKPYSIHNQPWPEVDEAATKEDEITLIVQVNGKVRDRISVPVEITEGEAKSIALESEGAKRFMGDSEPRKVIYIPRRLVNIVL
jgi:leucyl-tRNA synthetase